MLGLRKKVLQAARKNLLIIQGVDPWRFCTSDHRNDVVLFSSRDRHRVGLVRGLSSRLKKVIVPLYLATMRGCHSCWLEWSIPFEFPWYKEGPGKVQ